MGFNYRYEKVKFYEEWLPKQKMMREVGMSEEAIQQMFDYDWNWFKDRRRHESRQKPFTEDPYTVKRHALISTNCKLYSPNSSMITTHFDPHNTISAVATTHCRSLIKSKDFLIFDKAMTCATALMNF